MVRMFPRPFVLGLVAGAAVARVRVRMSDDGPAGRAGRRCGIRVTSRRVEHDEFTPSCPAVQRAGDRVHGLPSGRLLKVVPPSRSTPRTAWATARRRSRCWRRASASFLGTTRATTQLWTDHGPDGRWLFIDPNNTPRIARISLDFETEEIIEIPQLRAITRHRSSRRSGVWVGFHAAHRADPAARTSHRGVQGCVQGHDLVHPRRTRSGPEMMSRSSSAPGLQLRHRTCAARARRTAGRLHHVQHGAGEHAAGDSKAN